MKNTIVPNNKNLLGTSKTKSVNSKKKSKSSLDQNCNDGKNINDVQTNDELKDTVIQIHKTIHYFQILIQKTVLAIQGYKTTNIIGGNDLSSATNTLEMLYTELSNNLILLETSSNYKTVQINLDTIRSDIGNVFKQYGTEHLCDLINIIFGDSFLSNVEWDNNKYLLLDKYFHPVNFKIIPWSTDSQPQLNCKRIDNKINNENDTLCSIEKNKIVEESTIVEKSVNLDCFDLSRTSKLFYMKVYGIKIAIQNYEKKILLLYLVL